jgi:ubiquinone/menaquinone biosynthesis C-methylase UbiE
VKEKRLSDSNESRQLQLIREKFTETVGTFADYALDSRIAEAEKLADAALRGVANADEWRALDVACGPGTFTRTLAQRTKFTVGFDLTPALLSRALRTLGEAKLPAGASFALACGDASRMPFRDNSFDVATCGYSFHHMLHPEKVMAEIARVVRPGGRVALLDMALRTAAQIEANTRIEQTRDPSHARALTVLEFPALLERSGFRVISNEVGEKTRDFDEWMNAMNVPPGTRAYNETRRLLLATMRNDDAGMQPRIRPDGKLEYTLPAIYIAGEKK